MILDKIQHHLSITFFTLLVLTQALVFVGVKAIDTNNILSAVWLEPLVNQNIEVGSNIYWQSMLSNANNIDFSTVYFTLTDSNGLNSVNFEANLQTDGTWLSPSSWNTTKYAPGIYYISAIAQNFSKDVLSTDIYQSSWQEVNLIASVSSSNFVSDVDSLDAINLMDNTVTTSTPNVVTDINANDTQLDITDPIIPTSTTTSTSTPNDNQNLNPGGEDLAEVYELNFVQPSLNGVIDGDSFIVEVTTSWEADNLTLEFLDTENLATTSGLITIPNIDGYNWSTNISLDSSFIDGDSYLLVAKSIIGATQEEIETEIALILDRQTDIIDFSNASITIEELSNTNLSGQINLKALTNTINGQVVFNILDTNDVIISSATGNFLRASSLDGEYFSQVFLDSLSIVNGNYKVQAHLIYNNEQITSSDIVAISIYNSEDAVDGGLDGDDDPDDSIDVDSNDTDGDINADNNEGDGDIDADLDGEDNNQPEENDNTFGIDLYDTCDEVGIITEEACLEFRATMDLLDARCIEQNIYQADNCEDYLNNITVDLECQANNIIDVDDCKDYLMENYAGDVRCELDDLNTCNQIIRDEYLNRLVVAKQDDQLIDEVINSLLNQYISIKDLSQALDNQNLNSLESLPLIPKDNINILLGLSIGEIVLEDEYSLTFRNKAVIILDNDGDGLSDDMEEYYGTDINNPDSDNDGYEDGIEVKNNYNPLGEGALEIDKNIFDQIFLDGHSIEQPKEKSSKIDKNFDVTSINTENNQLVLKGKAQANTWINLYLYSGLPLIMTTKTDASGNWSYDLKNSLTDGHHRVFVTINDKTGKIVKQSRAVSFLVKEARAVSPDNYFDQASTPDKVNNMLIYYILGAVFLTFLALGVVIFLHKGKSSDLEV